MRLLLGTATVALLVGGCGVAEQSVGNAGDEPLSTNAGLTWEQFQERIFVEPESGVMVADGDTAFFSQKQLREFYELNVAQGQLIINRVGNADDRWSDAQKLNLTYCVSDTFGSRKATVVSAMAEATGAWAAAANVKYVYVPAQDATCTASNNNVLFDVRPVNVNGNYLARAFFPSTSRSGRNVLIDNTAFTSGNSVNVVGVLRHELGHTLGFRHEHTRPEAGTCFEDNNWRVLTAYDSASVMHYPQCNGTGSFASLQLTALDKQGVAAIYGAAGGGGGGGGGGGTTFPNTESFNGSVARGATNPYGPFAVKPGTTFHAVISGTGDADLYVRFGSAPTASAYNCRPYLDGSAEECTLTVPTTATTAFINVVGFAAASYTLKVEYTKAAGGGGGTGTPKTDVTNDAVAKGEQAQYEPVDVVPGTQFKATLSGTGDPDLYLRFDAAPSLTAFDCRPYLDGASETCSVTVPAGATKAYLMVYGYAAATYTMTLTWTAP